MVDQKHTVIGNRNFEALDEGLGVQKNTSGVDEVIRDLHAKNELVRRGRRRLALLQIPTIHNDDEEEFTASSEEEIDLNIEDVRYEQALV